MAKIKGLGNNAINDVNPSDVGTLVSTTIKILKDLLKKSGDNKK